MTLPDQRKRTPLPHYPMETRLGWVVAVSAIDTETTPTLFTRQGAEELAARLNADESDEERQQ